MSLVMVLEIETGVRLDDVAATLVSLEATIDRNPFIRGGLLPGSKCAFGLKVHPLPVTVRAQDVQVDWKSGKKNGKETRRRENGKGSKENGIREGG